MKARGNKGKVYLLKIRSKELQELYNVCHATIYRWRKSNVLQDPLTLKNIIDTYLKRGKNENR